MRSSTSWIPITVVLVGACGGDDDEFADSTPTLDQIVADFRADLEDRGYEVATGDRKLFRVEDCTYVLQTIGNCLANNPTAPYVLPTVPLWDDEFVDEHMRDVFGPMPGDTWVTHRVDDHEAIVLLAHMPPSAAYFGMESYVFSREGALNPNDAIYRAVTDPFMKSVLFMESPNSDRPLVFASVGDSVNDAVIEQQAGSVWGRERYFISTPDEAIARDLTEALVRVGVPTADHVFVEPLSPQVIRTGLGEHADDVTALIRYALPDDEAGGEAWRQDLPFTVLRVRHPHLPKGSQPFAAPVRQPRTAQSELWLDGDVAELVGQVKQRWGQDAAQESDFESLLLTVDLLGEHCLQRPMNCLGDNSDADYQISATRTIDGGEVLAVVGTLGTETGNATYTSLAVNWIPPLIGLENLSHHELAGSASSFATGVDHTDKLYVQYFARDCTNVDHCFTITDVMIPPGGGVKIIQRNYVLPGSTRAPDPHLLVNPVLIVLDGTHRPTP